MEKGNAQLITNNMYKLNEEKEGLEISFKTLVESNSNLQASYQDTCKELKESDRLLGEALKDVKRLGDQLQGTEAKFAELESIATEIADYINPIAVGSEAPPLVERLKAVPARVVEYVKKTCSVVGTQILAVVQSFYPTAELEDVAEGKAEECSDEQFQGYQDSLRPVVDKVVAGLELN